MMRIRPNPCPALALGLLTVLSTSASAQTTSPYYLGTSLGLTHVSNVFRDANANNGDRVVSLGLLGGLDQRFGRQRVTLDASLQDNRYNVNRDLNNRSYSLRSALEWQTVHDLSGTVSATSNRSLADFNAGNGVDPIFKKNTERDDEYSAITRLGVGTRYSVEGGLTHRRRDFSAAEYDRFVYQQNTGSLGVYATPGANVKLGLAARRTKGKYPRYPIFFLGFPVGSQPNDFSRNDFDFTTVWTTGGSSSLNTRISSTRTRYNLASEVLANGVSTASRNFRGTTGAVGWSWLPTAKLKLGVQFTRDAGQESLVQAADVNRVYNSWRLNANYALTAKLGLTASASTNRSHRSNNTFDNDNGGVLGVQWAYSRSLSLGCQYNHSGRDSSTLVYIYSANSFGCTGQALIY